MRNLCQLEFWSKTTQDLRKTRILTKIDEIETDLNPVKHYEWCRLASPKISCSVKDEWNLIHILSKTSMEFMSETSSVFWGCRNQNYEWIMLKVSIESCSRFRVSRSWFLAHTGKHFHRLQIRILWKFRLGFWENSWQGWLFCCCRAVHQMYMPKMTVKNNSWKFRAGSTQSSLMVWIN